MAQSGTFRRTRIAVLCVAAALLLLGGLAGLRYLVLRQITLAQLRDLDEPLSPAAREFGASSSDPAILQALVLRIENGFLDGIGRDAEICLAKRGMDGIRPLAERIDQLIAQRQSVADDVRQNQRIDIRLLKLLAAFDYCVAQMDSSHELGALFLGREEQKARVIADYRNVKNRLFVGQ